jgi:hypothetical protein
MTTPHEISKALDAWVDMEFPHNEGDVPYPTGHQNAVIGAADLGEGPTLVLDQEVVLLNLEEMGMDPMEAIEFFDFNILGGAAGYANPPIYITRFNHEDITKGSTTTSPTCACQKGQTGPEEEG